MPQNENIKFNKIYNYYDNYNKVSDLNIIITEKNNNRFHELSKY